LKGQEHLITLDIDLEWGKVNLKEKILWDIACTDNSPEEFAFSITNEQGLPAIVASFIAL
jgi:hypothetical protein